ncbi:MAG TPA: hypothetical protein VM537_18460 [Anaerolineae bacterium]|nr:hypothetical protein [Anaerolineae bacterium]
MPRILVLVMTLVLAIWLAGCAQTMFLAEPTLTAEPTPTAVLLAPEDCVALENRLFNIGGGVIVTPSPPGQFLSLVEAEQRAVFDILLPAHLPEEVTLQCVRLPSAGRSPGPSMRAVYLIYSGGLTIRQVVARSAPYESLKDRIEDGWIQVRVSGVPGLGREPGGGRRLGSRFRYNGMVQWWLEGVFYVVTGDLPVEELLRIAESME